MVSSLFYFFPLLVPFESKYTEILGDSAVLVTLTLRIPLKMLYPPTLDLKSVVDER